MGLGSVSLAWSNGAGAFCDSAHTVASLPSQMSEALQWAKRGGWNSETCLGSLQNRHLCVNRRFEGMMAHSPTCMINVWLPVGCTAVGYFQSKRLYKSKKINALCNARSGPGVSYRLEARASPAQLPAWRVGTWCLLALRVAVSGQGHLCSCGFLLCHPYVMMGIWFPA